MMLKPTLEKVAKEFEDKLILAKAATDDNKDAATKYGVMSIPAVKLFKDGKIVDEFVGAQPEATIKQWLDQKL